MNDTAEIIKLRHGGTLPAGSLVDKVDNVARHIESGLYAAGQRVSPARRNAIRYEARFALSRYYSWDALR